MKFKIKRQDLINSVNIVEKAVSVKSTINILEGIYIEAKENEVIFIGNNLELCIICKIPAEIESEGRLVVKANLFSSAVKKLPDFDDEAFIETDENSNIILSCGNAKFNFSTASAEEFPKPSSSFENEKKLLIKENILKSMIRQTVYAVAQNDIKPYLAGVYFNLDNNILDVVGCDSYRLAIRSEEIDSENVSFIIPGKTAKELCNILGESEKEVNIKLSDKNAVFEFNNFVLISRLIDGNYLNYKSLTENESKLSVVTETKLILDSVDRASLITSEATKTYVILNIENDYIYVNCETVFGKVNDKISVNMSGEPIKIAFNPRYLLEAFKNIDSQEIKIEFGGPRNPISIRPLEGNNFTSIVVPVKFWYDKIKGNYSCRRKIW